MCKEWKVLKNKKTAQLKMGKGHFPKEDLQINGQQTCERTVTLANVKKLKDKEYDEPSALRACEACKGKTHSLT